MERQFKKGEFIFEHEMTIGDLIDTLLLYDPDLIINTSIFKPRHGLIYKKPLKYSQIRVGGNCLYMNNYLSD